MEPLSVQGFVDFDVTLALIKRQSRSRKDKPAMAKLPLPALRIFSSPERLLD